ncbi:thiamine pyrophosphate-dependent enzyme [Candidatus Methylomirabilis sp.]|uniref:thiamine pyrophosphate-dependent enzyme n=1 Tax=Candidatus Methylomirabilis sp. TaxID=2032687 RepID=UPI002A61F12D|nr:thiamine pyrophosphate-dependent enzyme [Candidatus Methylomirabilis sp.]
MADQERAYNPLDEEHVEQAAGTKARGIEKEIHESALPPTGVLELDLEQYVGDFNERIIGAYAAGTGEQTLPADVGVARSLIPPGTGALRDFSYIAPEIPRFDRDRCVGCMACVTECPDTAILGKAIPKSRLEAELNSITDDREREAIRAQWGETKKYYELYEKKGEEGALFGIFVDPTKCKGCAECVEVCGTLGYHALTMVKKDETTIPRYRNYFNFFRQVGATPRKYINERALADMMLHEEAALLYVGGAGSCMGCGEATAIRMMLAATGFVYGAEAIGIVAATGCNTVYGSTYPYNPFLVPWTNSLFENAPAMAMGVRAKWNQRGWQDKKLWVIGGDGAMYDIGFQSLSRMLAAGMDINVLILDTQVYSNTGGQASSATYTGQDAKMATFGKTVPGKQERRKELALIAMMHPDTLVAQTTAAHVNHFYRAIMAANEYPGPAVVTVYTTCQPEHGVADDRSSHQAKLAVDSRAFPLFMYDPRKGERIKERLSLAGNPAMGEDWYRLPHTGEVIDFLTFARTEGRFAKQFDTEGRPSDILRYTQTERLQYWRRLQELAGVR